MKRLSRLTALLLAMLMFVSVFAFADGVKQEDLDLETWNELTGGDGDTTTGTSSAPVITTGGEVYTNNTETGETTEAPLYDSEYAVNVAMNAAGAEGETAVSLSQYGKVDLSVAASGCQWQVNIAGQWIDVSGETGSTFSATYAKLQSVFMLNNQGAAQVRCVAADGTVSDVVTIHLDAYAAVAIPETDDELAYSVAPASSTYSLRNANEGIALAEDTDVDSTTYNVVVNYIFENNEIVADPYTANLAKGTNFSTKVEFPSIKGYLPYLGNDTESTTSLEINITDIQANVTYTVTYKPTNVDYTVIHYWQNIENDSYSEHERETLQGLTKTVVPEVANEYDGFYALNYEKPAIAADGSTVVEIYYDRYYYLMNFVLDGGYGTEPIYGRFGADVKVTEPTKAGYDFMGWSPALPSTIPVDGGTYTAQWGNAKTVNYTVVYWRENANDTNYSFWASEIKKAQAGAVISGTDSIVNSEKGYFTFNEALTDKNVVIKGDGSSVINVYYTRNYYTLIFYHNGDCMLAEHTHSTTACRYSSDYSNYKIFKVITAKYEADISDEWPTADDVDGLGYWTGTGVPSVGQSSKILTMTGNICIGYGLSNGNKFLAHYQSTKYTLNYWFESFDQTSTTTSSTRVRWNNKYYDLSTDYSQSTYYSNNQRTWGYKDITGLEPAESDETASVTTNNTFNLYYNRLRYIWSFQSVDTEVYKITDIMYDKPLKDYTYSDGTTLLKNFVPPYPSTLEPNAFAFAGWYTTPECFEGTEFNFDTAKMPNGNLTVYAKWAPINHTVEFYRVVEDIEAGTKLYADATVPHGSKIETVPATPSNGGYKFVGWFYMENGVEKAFDFANMPINKDMQIYAKWNSDVLKNYFVYYMIQGTETQIADPTTGSALAGTTKTFDAKGGSDLYTGYQEGYFPVTKSHSLTIDISDTATNSFTFYYVQKEAVPYTVYYVTENQNAAGTLSTVVIDGKTYYMVADTKTVSDNRKAVVTETFEPVSGYMPDAYQKRLVVDGTDGAVNNIVFVYTVDTEHAYYKVTHYTQNTDGVTWTENYPSEIVGTIGMTNYSADPRQFDGFTYRNTEYVVGDNAPLTTAPALTGDGLSINLYYTRNKYPYQVNYLENGTGKILATAKTGEAFFGAVVSESAIDIEHYQAIDPKAATLTIKVEDELKLNVINFYYEEKEVTINYEVVGPTGCGTVTPESETVKEVSGTVQGSTAEASSEVYRFVGWYATADCTGTALTTAAKYVPAKNADGENVAATYYAKFEYNLTSLTISKTGEQNENASFIFGVYDVTENEEGTLVVQVAINGNSSVTVDRLIVDRKYEVRELTGNWRYDLDGNKPITLAPSGNAVTFENDCTEDQWLGSNDYEKNEFNIKSSSGTN